MSLQRSIALILVTTAVPLAGCGPYSTYQFGVNVPWPDEPAPKSARGLSRELMLSRATIAWHMRMKRDSLRHQIESVSDNNAIYVLTRDALARRSSGDGPARLRYVEARIGRVLIPPGIGGDRDARIQIVQSALARDMMPASARYIALSVRSFEYESESDFMRAVDDSKSALAKPALSTSTQLVPLGEWSRANSVERRRIMQELAHRLTPAAPSAENRGPALPSPEVLPDEAASLARQIELALPILIP